MFVQRVTIVTVISHSMEVLPAFLASLAEQTEEGVTILVLDNASHDGAEAFIRKAYPNVHYLRNVRNLGRSAACNQAVRYVVEHSPRESLQDRFIVFADPHVIFDVGCVENLLAAAKDRPSAAIFGPLILRAYSENAHDESLKETIQSERIESCGFLLGKDRSVIYRESGKIIEQDAIESSEVFGASPVVYMVRLSALMDIAYSEQEVFDPMLSEGMESIDIGWRAQLLGYGVWCIARAKAYHHLGKFRKESKGWWGRHVARRGLAKEQRRLLSSGYWILLLKNETTWNLMCLCPRLVWRLTRGLVYALCFDRSLFAGFSYIGSSLPDISRRRFRTQSKRTESSSEMRSRMHGL